MKKKLTKQFIGGGKVKMTNNEIIFAERLKLMEKGILKGTGECILTKDKLGNEKEIEIPAEIHTFKGWKERGYIVKKGEKSNIKISIWKHTVVKNKSDDKEIDIEEEKMFKKISAFFTDEQVEKIA